jgi:hypothetical protein
MPPTPRLQRSSPKKSAAAAPSAPVVRSGGTPSNGTPSLRRSPRLAGATGQRTVTIRLENDDWWRLREHLADIARCRFEGGPLNGALEVRQR